MPPPFMVIHCPGIAFISSRAGVASRPQLCLPRKLIIPRAKLDSALVGLFHEEYGSTLEDDEIDDDFPHLLDTKTLLQRRRRRDALKRRAVLRVSVPGLSGTLPPHILYLLDLGFDIEQLKVMAGRHPAFAYYSLEGKTRPLIEFLLDLGVSKLDLPNILVRIPSIFGKSLSENLIPTVAFFETLGVERSQWAKLMSRYPAILVVSRKKVEAVVQFLYKLGLSGESIGNIITYCPQIVGNSVEGKLRPTAEYFRSLGVDFAVLLRQNPGMMKYSIENNLKPSTEFFLDNGFSVEELRTMISNFGRLYYCSLKGSIVPKWEFFLKMDYQRQDLVKHPRYFSYSLEERIKPRYEAMKTCGVKLSLSQLLALKDNDFELLLKKKIAKLHEDEFCN